MGLGLTALILRERSPVVLDSKIVMSLQTITSKQHDLEGPRIKMASAFNSDLKHNVKSDKAHLKLTVRYSHFYTKAKLLDVVSRVAQSTGITGYQDNKHYL
jgi:metal-dependent amidase/aminoacylase/carboxypeptidase family protein